MLSFRPIWRPSQSRIQGSPGGGLAEAFPISGQIDPKAFPFLVVQLHRHGATGSLKVEGPSYQKAVYFRSGRVLFGSSNDPRDQLGAILIESGKITPEQLADVNAKVGPGNPLAKVLSDTGFVSQRELSDAARAKVERILSDVLAYTGGTFDFEDGVLPKGAVDLKLATERLMMAAVRRVGDRNFVLRHIDGLDAVLGPTADMVPRLGEVEAETGGLPQHLDGRRNLKEAAASARLEEFEAAKIACGLLFLGLVERVRGSRPRQWPSRTWTRATSWTSAPPPPRPSRRRPPIVVPTMEPEPGAPGGRATAAGRGGRLRSAFRFHGARFRRDHVRDGAENRDHAGTAGRGPARARARRRDGGARRRWHGPPRWQRRRRRRAAAPAADPAVEAPSFPIASASSPAAGHAATASGPSWLAPPSRAPEPAPPPPRGRPVRARRTWPPWTTS